MQGLRVRAGTVFPHGVGPLWGASGRAWAPFVALVEGAHALTSIETRIAGQRRTIVARAVPITSRGHGQRVREAPGPRGAHRGPWCWGSPECGMNPPPS